LPFRLEFLDLQVNNKSQCGPYSNKEGFVEVIHEESQSGKCAPRNPAQASDFLRGESPESHTEQREAGVPR